MHNKIYIKDIKAITDKDSYNSDQFKSNLELIIMVDKNYTHIDQLDCLRKLFPQGGGSYITKYHPDLDTLLKLCGKIAVNTFWNHYVEEHRTDVYDVYKELYGEHPIKDYKQ